MLAIIISIVHRSIIVVHVSCTTRLKLLLVELVAVTILLRGDDQIVRSPWININLSEFTGGNSVLEEDIKFGCETVSICTMSCDTVNVPYVSPFGSGSRK